MDNIDRRILHELQQDGSLSNVELARRVGLSASPCLTRVRALEASGVIRQYVALADGLGLACLSCHSEMKSWDFGTEQAFFGFCHAGFGAWTDEEINAWTPTELNALFLQLVSGDIREAGIDTDAPDWEAYEAGADEGQYSGNISTDAGRVYYYLGS